MKLMTLNRKTLAIMVTLGACARLVPHPWNFTPMMAIGLYSGAKSEKLHRGIFATIFALLLSDAVMGFYSGMWYVYAASVVPVLIGRLLRERNEAGYLAAGAACSSVSFFVLTNFMVWAGGHLYPHTTAGLAACFVAGLPFYRNQVLGDAFYTVALFGGDWLIQRLAQPSMRTA
jgi:hypothetical protein